MTDAISHMLHTNPQVKVYAYKVKGTRHDVGNPLGRTRALIAMALDNPKYKDQIQMYMVESLKRLDQK